MRDRERDRERYRQRQKERDRDTPRESYHGVKIVQTSDNSCE